MIALITSCINPFKDDNLSGKSYFTVDERISQTINTINQLAVFPFTQIYLLDNSMQFDFERLTADADGRLSIRHFQQYQFKNKGINELLLLLSVLAELPDDEQIFKISGRYNLNQNFSCDLSDGVDFKFKGYRFYSKRGTVSTRGYFVNNKRIYEKFMLAGISEVFSYSKRIVGWRSAIGAIMQTLKPEISGDSNTAIEFAFARVLKSGPYSVQFVDAMGVEGQIAGAENLDFIKE